MSEKDNFIEKHTANNENAGTVTQALKSYPTSKRYVCRNGTKNPNLKWAKTSRTCAHIIL